MRWGVRRAASPSGSSSTKRTPTKSAVKKAAPKKKSIKDMSDTELREKINRINMERQYSALTRSRGSKIAGQTGKIASEVVLNAGKQIVTAQLVKFGSLGVQELLKAATGAK